MLFSGFILKLIPYLVIFQTLNSSLSGTSHFSTKTSYAFVKNDDLIIILPDLTCTAAQINMVHRHGHRYPSARSMHEMKVLEDILLNTEISPLLKFNVPWKMPFLFEQDSMLTIIGEQELYSLGERIKARFPDIFKNNYSPFAYTFQSSCKLRCTHSAISLAAGLFHGQGTLGSNRYQPIALETFPCHDDKLLRFLYQCEEYMINVYGSSSAKEEFTKFEQGPEVKTVLKKVKKRLEKSNMRLEAKHLKIMFTVCSYEIAMFEGNSTTGICSLFDNSDLEVMEYLLDLKQFYIRFLGHKVTYESSCLLFTDIVNSLNKYISNSTTSKLGIFRSTHGETILPLFALLGIFRDSNMLTANNYYNSKTRTFWGAFTAPFSGNLYFVLYYCHGLYKIQLYVNEQLVQLPCCEEKHDCLFENFLKYYAGIVNNCDFSQICKLQKYEL